MTDACMTEAAQASRVVVSGVRNRAARDRVIKWASRAAAALELHGLRVEVRGALRARRGLVAGASRDHIWLRRSILKDSDERLGLVLYEEAAHHTLTLVGVPAGTYGIFLHEVYATWFSYHQLISVDGGDREKLRTRPLAAGRPTPAFMYDLGGALGATLAGHGESRARLEAWLAKGQLSPGWSR